VIFCRLLFGNFAESLAYSKCACLNALYYPVLSRFSTSEFFRAKRPFSFVGIHFEALENRQNWGRQKRADLNLTYNQQQKLLRHPIPPPPSPPQRQCCYHDTNLQCWLKTFTQHCQWGERGNSKKRSNYTSVDVSKWKKSLKYVKSHYFCTWLNQEQKLSTHPIRPPFLPPPQRQCCYHDTKLQCWQKTFTQHCQWGEGGK
jgi:hypothetical protein